MGLLQTGGLMALPKKIYYRKGYLIEFLDGTRKLVKTIQRGSYEYVASEVDAEGGTPTKYDISNFNTDYIVYTSHVTKYGLIPIHSIKELYEVKFRMVGNEINVFDLKDNQIMI